MLYEKVKKNADYQRIFKKGKRIYSPKVTIIYCPSKELKMGIAISKKYGKAVQRNRIKRLLRQAFYNTCSLIEKPCAVIIMPKIAEEYTLDGFEQSLKICFARINKCV